MYLSQILYFFAVENLSNTEKHKVALTSCCNQLLVFPLSNPLMMQWSWILKNGPIIKKNWLLHVIDHITRYLFKKVSWCYLLKERIDCEENFSVLDRVFGHSNKILVDNGGNFAILNFNCFGKILISGYVPLLQRVLGVTV